MPQMIPLRNLLCSLLVLHFSSPAMANEEVRTLMEIKASLDPKNQVLLSWTSDGDPCGADFEGVACDVHGKVVNISLQGRGLSGQLSPALAQLRSLTGLYMHYNSIGGPIPREIGNLSKLAELYLNVNNLTGAIPVEIGKMSSLQVLELCYNQLTGSIPTQLGMLKKLTVLAMQSNRLAGAIPASLGDLSHLKRLDLSFNRLFGSIPSKISRMPLLSVLDVRNNSLSGDVPSDFQELGHGFQYANNTGLCGVGFDLLQSCPPDDALKPKKPEPFGPNSDGNTKTPHVPRSANVTARCNDISCVKASKYPTGAGSVLIGSIVIVGVLVCCCFFAFLWYRRQKQRIGSSLDVSDRRRSIDQMNDSKMKNPSALISNDYSAGWDSIAEKQNGIVFSLESSEALRFNLEEIECATQYFSDVNLLEKSTFAATYKGVLRDGNAVAVKSISKTNCKTEESSFLKGLKLLTLMQHDNIIGLKGFCCSRGRGECFLVYEFMVNGRLTDYLDSKDGPNHRQLEWKTRVSVIKGIAKGIEYLHSSKGNKPSLVHQNLSADKIHFDHHFTPRIADCGLHKLLADDAVFSALKGSAAMGYLAPEYTTTGRFTDKSDVYAFGILVFQIMTGKRIVSHLQVGSNSGKLEELIDENLDGNFSRQEAAVLAGIALLCTSDLPCQRPSMAAVLQQLGCSSC